MLYESVNCIGMWIASCHAVTMWRIAILVAVLGLEGSYAQAGGHLRSLNGDRIRESLKRFRSLHKGAQCGQRPAQDSEVAGSPWIDCTLNKGIVLDGQKLLAEADSTKPFGLLASFYENRLVELTYTLDLASIEPLLPNLKNRYGGAANLTRDSKGSLDSISWTDRKAEVSVRLVPISPAVADKNFLRIVAGASADAVQVRMRSTVPLRSSHKFRRLRQSRRLHRAVLLLIVLLPLAL
jgi:hypothetical protein